MSASFGILRVAPFAGFVQRFDDLIGSTTTMSLYFIHSRRWRENHDGAVIALYSNTAAKKELPAFEITSDCILAEFLAADIEDLKKECRKRAPQDLETVIANAVPA